MREEGKAVPTSEDGFKPKPRERKKPEERFSILPIFILFS